MAGILATLIFLLADGTPAKSADVRCLGLAVFESGSDIGQPMPEGSSLIVDARGAVII